MGGCLSLDREGAKARTRSEEIDRQLAELAKQERNVIKILLLGAGESGKSTLVKQMKIIHSDGFTREELSSFRPTVMDNLLSSMKYVLSGMGLLRINLQSHKNKWHAQTILTSSSCFDKQFNVLPDVANALHELWADRGVRLAVARGYEYELNDSALYLFENMDRICDEKYVPTPTDVLRARVRTNGIIETHFKINDVIVSMFDVGGQRSQRRKWIYCFDNVRAVMFVVSLSGYDMTLLEEPSVNRLDESLTLFSQIVNNCFFREASFVLFLNKFDLFREKILYSGRHLRLYCPDYRGPDYDVDRGALFIQHKFLIQNRSPTKIIYPHFTTATDTSNVQVVFQVVVDTVVKENLRHVTLL
ncbi:guanine nucleotide-binding protein G(o) subunit alpha-like [Schistocerca americana]|nr:guanine nucleotide-binding protein G(o) subunit alpha-like [Schistocerca americana]XP_047108975.1 guanine nucleotide-binding protein G(o) subunit alpha-like [Schistocerca piceifrons]XP_049774904.1 guanine nucleotide-binding protein G(o) subunit alpha-like isoform X1 [Schistocerca cancellata]XP_049801589.1 guanine nucleotide-binding protein G(o) subunit alpha-like isoform X1 [Schistocerca nitens]XP_049852970.1 guanine nucleotide-binding protein G(o) subunit alpha-like [Schistocerca gregaria]